MLYVKDLKKGQVVYDCYCGENLKVTVVDDPIIEGEDYRVKVITDNGKVFDLYQNTKHLWLGPKLYNEPEYYTFKDGVSVPNNVEI